jgi:HK97 family phage major capsid protein
MEKRTGLLNEAKSFAASADTTAFAAKKAEIEALDAQYGEQAGLENDLNALSGAEAADLRSFAKFAGNDVENTENGGVYSNVEYRRAFMANAISGAPIPARFKNDSTMTADIGSVIPTTVMQRIIEKLDASGMILPRVTRINIKGGVDVPTSTVKPVAEWVDEGAGSGRRKKTTGKISFNYYKLRCAVAVTLETDTVSLEIFEAKLIDNVVEAMVIAEETAIISGDGVGKPTGIITETPNSGQAITATGGIEDLDKMEAALPIEYEAGAEYCMTKKAFEHYANLRDTNGQPVGRVNYGGLSDRPERVIKGRSVVLCNYLPSYDSASAGKVIAFLFNFKDYILNTNLQMGLKRYEDNETDDIVTKAVTLVDGKVVDKGSLVTLLK